MEESEQEAGTVALADRLTGVVEQVTVRPEDDALPVSVTEPTKLNILVKETLTETVVWPTFKLAPVTEMVKSPTWTVTEAE